MTLRFLKIALFSGLLAMLMTSCGRDNGGQLIGAQDRPKMKGAQTPLGMVYIPSGDFTIGQTDQDIFNNYNQRQQTVTMNGFYMDETEITNNEYRQFVNYAREIEARDILGYYTEDDFGNEIIDWDIDIDYTDPALEELFFTKDMSLSGRREFNNDDLNYTYSWINWKKAAESRTGVRRDEVLERRETKVYPDIFVWIRDFSYSYNEPMTRRYFEDPTYDDYPVVGVTWDQAKAFCHWRTEFHNSVLDEEDVLTEDYRLPTEFEWEYAARGGRDLSPYGWGGYYVRNAKGCLLANFKPGRGDYRDDGGTYTVKVGSYMPNDYGLLDMSGNVSEWTETAYAQGTYNVISDLNPDYKYDATTDDPDLYKLKVVKGGSWKDIYYYLQTGVRDYQYQDSAKSYIGFRCVKTFLGRSISDF